MRLQEENARAAQEFFANGVRLLQLQRHNAEFVQCWTVEPVDALREQTEQNARTAEPFTRSISKQQEGFRALAQTWADAYRALYSPFVYLHEGVRTPRRATQQGLEATEQVARQGLRVAEEATEQTGMALRQTEKAAREAEREVTVFAALLTADYEELTLDEISRRLDGLTVQQLEHVREYEKRNKNRETLIERIDRKIRANS